MTMRALTASEKRNMLLSLQQLDAFRVGVFRGMRQPDPDEVLDALGQANAWNIAIFGAVVFLKLMDRAPHLCGLVYSRPPADDIAELTEFFADLLCLQSEMSPSSLGVVN